MVFRAVYRGEHVAVKVLLNQTTDNAFFREIGVFEKLRHQFVVSFRGISSNPSACDKFGSHLGICVVMQLAEHGSIFNAMKDRNIKARFRPWSERLRFLANSASGLLCLHSQKAQIIHRDIKAGNVLVNKHFEPLIADFGLSRDVGDHKIHWQGEGTLAYSSPELLDGADCSTASDVYAFAMLMWFVATASEPRAVCEEPWADKTIRQVQADVLAGKRPEWPEEIKGEEFDRFRLVS